MTIVRVSIALAESVARWLDEGMPEVGTKEWSREEVDSFEGSRDDERAIEDYNEDYAGAEEDTEDYVGVEEDDEDKKTEDIEDHPLKEDPPHIEDPTAEEKPPAIILGTLGSLVDRFSLKEWKSRKKKQFSLRSRITLAQ